MLALDRKGKRTQPSMPRRDSIAIHLVQAILVWLPSDPIAVHSMLFSNTTKRLPWTCQRAHHKRDQLWRSKSFTLGPSVVRILFPQIASLQMPECYQWKSSTGNSTQNQCKLGHTSRPVHTHENTPVTYQHYGCTVLRFLCADANQLCTATSISTRYRSVMPS